MQVTETSSEGLKREFTITLSAQDIDSKVDNRLAELAKTARIPGFRPGKVPATLMKQRYGQAVLGEVLEKALQDSSQQALTERNITPALQPKVEVTKYEQGEDLEYKIEVEVMPEVEPMDFSGIEIEKIEVAVPDQEVEETLERLAGQQKKTEPLTEARASQSGDVVVIDFKGSVDGETKPGMEGEDHHLELGSNSFIAGFEDQLIGLNTGDETTVNVTFPDEYVNDELAGREAKFEVKVKDILAALPIAIDDEMAKAYGSESLDDLKAKVRDSLGQQYRELTRSRVKRLLLDKLAEGHDFAVPAGMVDLEFEQIWKQVEQDREKGNEDPDDAGKDEETLKQEYRLIAERRVRLGLLLSEVGRRNEIDVSQEDLNAALIQEAQRHPGQERQVIEFFQNNPQALANLRAPLFEDKVVDFILDLAQVTIRSLSPEELKSELEAEAGEDADAADGEAKSKKKAAAPKKTAAKKAAPKKAAPKKAATKAKKDAPASD
ncbi:MAG: trigger factor [Kiloniellales bacterium]